MFSSRLVAFSAALVLTSSAAIIAAPDAPNAPEMAAAARSFDISMDFTEFYFQGPVTESGVPADGTPFVVTGYIYPGGTFETYGLLSGVNADGTPEFPELVVGEWHCSGFHLQDGDATSGPVVATTQVFDFDVEAPGSQMLITSGIEMAGFDVPFSRAVTGGTGLLADLRLDHRQVVVGGDLNGSGGFNTTMHFAPRP